MFVITLHVKNVNRLIYIASIVQNLNNPNLLFFIDFITIVVWKLYAIINPSCNHFYPYLITLYLFFYYFVTKLLYKYLYPSIWPYVHLVQGESRFSPSLFKTEVQFFVCRFLLHLRIYSIDILSVDLSTRQQQMAEM